MHVCVLPGPPSALRAGFTLEDTLRHRKDVSRLTACKSALPMLKFVLQGVSIDLLLVVVPHDSIKQLLTLDFGDSDAGWTDIRKALSVPKTQYVCTPAAGLGLGS